MWMKELARLRFRLTLEVVGLSCDLYMFVQLEEC
jgi:hypothetical protein